jgi:hypothetical protein
MVIKKCKDMRLGGIHESQVTNRKLGGLPASGNTQTPHHKQMEASVFFIKKSPKTAFFR